MVEVVGVYVFGGLVSYFSFVLMNVVLVKVVGVECIVMVVLSLDGVFNLLVFVVVDVVGVSEIYWIGGV